MNIKNQELVHVHQPNRAKSVLTGLVVGGLVGAGTMLLFAPQPGTKTRAEVREGAIHLRERTSANVKNTITEVKTKVNKARADVQLKAEDLQHRGKDLIARQLDRVSHAAEAGKNAIQGPHNGDGG